VLHPPNRLRKSERLQLPIAVIAHAVHGATIRPKQVCAGLDRARGGRLRPCVSGDSGDALLRGPSEPPDSAKPHVWWDRSGAGRSGGSEVGRRIHDSSKNPRLPDFHRTSNAKSCTVKIPKDEAAKVFANG
jgi:hypothetical protein